MTNKIYEYCQTEYHYLDEAIKKGKGSFGTPSYVRDDTWNNWFNARTIYGTLIKMFEAESK